LIEDATLELKRTGLNTFTLEGNGFKISEIGEVEVFIRDTVTITMPPILVEKEC